MGGNAPMKMFSLPFFIKPPHKTPGFNYGDISGVPF